MKHFIPHDSIDCGPSCLRMISHHYGKSYSLSYLRGLCDMNREGVSLYSLRIASEKIGFTTDAVEISLTYLSTKAKLPCILFWDGNHYVVLYKINGKRKNCFYIVDPSAGKIRLAEDNLRKYWLNDNEKGFALFLEPTQDFSKIERQLDNPNKGTPFKFLTQYFAKFKRNYFQVLFTFFAATLASFLFPFLTQAIVDSGIKLRDLNFVALILAFQLYLFITNTVADIIRSHLLLHISSRINISILTDFLAKLMKLPMKFFDSKMPGDLIQRIQDHTVIEEFISSTLLTFLFTILNIIVYSCILYYYSPSIFFIFLLGSILSVGWTLFFLEWRKSLNYMRFSELANTNDKLYEMASQMHEIKINRFENFIKAEWELIKIRLFKLELSRLSLEQYQRIGTDFFDQIRTILIIFLSVYSVIEGDLTLGMMLAISYIVGQLNIPIKEVTRLIQSYQLASIGLERMNEVYTHEDEDHGKLEKQYPKPSEQKGIELRNVNFSYSEGGNIVLKNLTLTIPAGKITAIVGSSGGGKTTLLKILLRFYKPSSGEIFLDGRVFDDIDINWWRSQCGVVMQEGHIFSETLLRNIVMGDSHFNKERLVMATEMACMDDFILDLPLNFETKIGKDLAGLSTGQKQRILLARAIYKNPTFLLLDEATSSLDSRNEKKIMKNLETLFEGKTVVIIAHRLSTVKNADQIAVLENGQIVETGSHDDLLSRKGAYFDLVRNQLEFSK